MRPGQVRPVVPGAAGPSGLGAVNSDGVMCGTGARCDDFAKNHPDVGSTPSQSDSDASWQNTVTPTSTDAGTLGQQFYEFGVNLLPARKAATGRASA